MRANDKQIAEVMNSLSSLKESMRDEIRQEMASTLEATQQQQHGLLACEDMASSSLDLVWRLERCHHSRQPVEPVTVLDVDGH